MKKLLSIFLCLIFICSITSCDTKENLSDNEKSENTLKETDVVENIPYTFISEQERLSWKDKIITVLSGNNSYEHIEYGCLGVALMNLNFDNTPELIVAYSGGSMGRNVTYAPGVGNFANGILVYTSVVSGQTVYQDWCTNQVHVYVPLGGGRGKKLTLRAPNDAYYKVRVWNTDYQ
jgi:hypothetical protein